VHWIKGNWIKGADTESSTLDLLTYLCSFDPLAMASQRNHALVMHHSFNNVLSL